MTGGDWVVVVPQKDFRQAKSRMELDPRDRQAVARALLRDTVTAARAASGVAEVVVVLDRRRDVEAVDDLGVRHVLAAGSGLNEALRQGERAARTRRPGCAVAALPADLPFVEPAVLGRALAYAQAHDRAFLADAEGHGTTLLTARPGQELRPFYGVGSRAAHRRSGAVELVERDLAPLRFDVDRLAHLRLVSPLVNHPNLAEALGGLPPEARGRMPATHPTLPEGQPWIC
ncbi:2-phospho-L-lactate guanylyltransferase [Actinacidiphila acidipaludis]|uniref:2-phospho-L-lactate guanylyltransferase n=1 Tax=Actinacidiphila acidipaludis TaxID=2873382 RepID=A0ABS7PZP2_9ACTN|nr:2-phospho-L-lactate guanylyltransferase [Streptomyces acidipaludis]MBY8876213.1 2-phospho-L-lactate guanylyltransferase [Streptomyces acidipaludis]